MFKESKELVVLCDGTGNAPETSMTNVLLLRHALQNVPDGPVAIKQSKSAKEGWEVDVYQSKEKVKRLVYYDRGLGASTSGDPLKEGIGALNASGITDNIKQAYYFLAENYEPNDKIFLFGFSRGAYTLRLLVTVLRYIGLINKENLGQTTIKDAMQAGFALYNKNVHPNLNPAVSTFLAGSHSYKQLIHFLGLWDTVPGRIKENVRNDGKLSSVVRTARHALSIDEERVDFKPELWLRSFETDSKQVWFPGVHSDVGGGYQNGDRHLANRAFHWMVEEAKKCNLDITQEMVAVAIKSALKTTAKPDDLGAQHDSLSDTPIPMFGVTWGAVRGTYLRPIAQTVKDERLHCSILERYGQWVEVLKHDTISTQIYRPANLTQALIAFKDSLAKPNDKGFNLYLVLQNDIQQPLSMNNVPALIRVNDQFELIIFKKGEYIKILATTSPHFSSSLVDFFEAHQPSGKAFLNKNHEIAQWILSNGHSDFSYPLENLQIPEPWNLFDCSEEIFERLFSRQTEAV